MTSRAATTAGRGGTRRAAVGTYLPPQHGAWAFLALPLMLGTAVAPANSLLILLAVAWVAAYPLSYAALGMARARRPARFRRPLLVWLAVVTPPVLLLVLARPWLVWVGLGYAALFAVNVGFARRNDERDLRNDLVFVLECTLMVPVTWAVAAAERTWVPPAAASVPHQVWVLTVVCALVLVGSTLHVKSLIRERRDPRYAHASRRFALASIPAAAALASWWGLPPGAWLLPPFLVLAARAYSVGRHPMRPARIGLIELGAFTLVVVTVVLAQLA